MRKVLIILTIIFVVLSIIFVILPMGTIALLPTGLAVLFGVLAFIKSDAAFKNTPKWLMIIAVALLAVALGKALLTKDKVENDQQFQQEQIQSTEDAQQELENLEMGDSLSLDTPQADDTDSISDEGDDFGGGL